MFVIYEIMRKESADKDQRIFVMLSYASVPEAEMSCPFYTEGHNTEVL